MAKKKQTVRYSQTPVNDTGENQKLAVVDVIAAQATLEAKAASADKLFQDLITAQGTIKELGERITNRPQKFIEMEMQLNTAHELAVNLRREVNDYRDRIQVLSNDRDVWKQVATTILTIVLNNHKKTL